MLERMTSMVGEKVPGALRNLKVIHLPKSEIRYESCFVVVPS